MFSFLHNCLPIGAAYLANKAYNSASADLCQIRQEIGKVYVSHPAKDFSQAVFNGIFKDGYKPVYSFSKYMPCSEANEKLQDLIANTSSLDTLFSKDFKVIQSGYFDAAGLSVLAFGVMAIWWLGSLIKKQSNSND